MTPIANYYALIPPVAPFCGFLASLTLQEDERYESVDDVRAQLKFFEQLDQIEKQRKEEQEREILLKAAKVTKRCIINSKKP